MGTASFALPMSTAVVPHGFATLILASYRSKYLLNEKTAGPHRYLRVISCFCLPICHESSLLECSAVMRNLNYWMASIVGSRPLDNAINLVIDETLFRIGHSYMTLIIDSILRYVIDIEELLHRFSVVTSI